MTTDNTQPSIRERLTDLLAEMREDDATWFYHKMAGQFSWAGTFFTVGDIREGFEAEASFDDSPISNEDIPDLIDKVIASWEWRRGIEQQACEYGWELIQQAQHEAIEQFNNHKGLVCTSDDPNNHQGDTCPIHEA